MPHHVPLSSFASAQPENGFLSIELNNNLLTADEQQRFDGLGYPETNYAISEEEWAKFEAMRRSLP